MLLLPGPAPTSADSFAQVLHSLLTGVVAASRDRVTAAGDYPALDRLTIDLTGAVPAPHAAGDVLDAATAGAVQSTATVANLSVVAKPFGAADRPVTVDASARDVRVEFVEAPGGRTAMRLAGATGGQFRADVALATVRTALIAEANAAAKAQGVTIKDAQVTWRTPDSRTLAVEAEIDAKKGFFPATVVVRGRVSIDDSLTATLSGLEVDGKGMGGTIGAGLLRPRLSKYEGQTYSLLALPLDGVKVKDVRFAATADRLSVEGEFAG